ncbi:MAG TPA: TspO/MBR family protein [Chitinophagaceae bacterium]|nr:TspO/MBR family protein [Chitinophagaceae bacterium]
MNKWLKLLVSLLLPLMVGFTASNFTETGEGSWYRSIQKPEWNPPNWVFAPVWTLLYVLMGIALYLVWKLNPSRQRNFAMGFWAGQMVLNFLWSFIFFRQEEIGWAQVEITALWLSIFFTILAFAKISKLSAWLLVPYISWVSFAAILNFAIWQLNK